MIKIVRDAINVDWQKFITSYAMFDEIRNFEEDEEFPGAHNKYADPAMETFLLQLQPVIEKVTGFQLYPTYSYYRIYKKGNELLPHKDRPSCEISATVCFGCSYDLNEYNWPIYIEDQKIELNPGDLAIYNGVTMKHWREKFERDWQVQGFFHYVKQTGIYSAYKYDGRERLGEE